MTIPMAVAIVTLAALAAAHRKGAPMFVRDYVAIAKTLKGDEGPNAVREKASWLGEPAWDKIKPLDDGSTARHIVWKMRATSAGPTTHVYLSTGFYACRREFGPSWCLIRATVES